MTGLASLLLGTTTTVAVVEVTPVMPAEEAGTLTLATEVPEYGVGVAAALEPVAEPTGTGTVEPEEEADCEPTELEESVGEEV